VAFPIASSTAPLSRTAAAALLARETLGKSVASSSSSHSNTKPSTTSMPLDSHQNTLYYYHFQTFPSEFGSSSPPNLLRRGVDKAVQAWNGMGLAPEGNWKRRIYVYGERLMDRIDFEETSLKHLHPPSNWKQSREEQQPQPPTGKQDDSSTSSRSTPQNPASQISLVYPSNFPSPLSNFRDTINGRTPLHRKGFWTWLIIAPFTAPFAIVPIIPNLPFFFCAWRSWSHHRAWKSADYLQHLLESGDIRAEPNNEFAELYPNGSADLLVSEQKTSESNQRESNPGSASTEKTEQGSGKVLLSSSGATEVVKRLKLQDSALAEITKALEQASARLAKARSGI